MFQRMSGARSLVLAALLVVACNTDQATDPPRPPNIVFILVDDLGYTDLASYGSGYYETPNIDALARSGLRMTDAYSAGPNCAPTRAALLSGQYAPRTGIYTVDVTGPRAMRIHPLRPVSNVTRLPLETITIAQALQQAGYVTGMFGKWHLGDEGEYHPSRRGFDEAIVSQDKHFGFATEPPVAHAPGAYLSDFLTDQAVDFIRRHRDERFFLYLPHFAVHGPHAAKPESIAHFREKPPAGGHFNPTYAAMIASVDESVGRIVAALDELALADDTLVIFTSDNGGVGGYERRPDGRATGITDNAPLRSGKGSLYEGGIRVPCIMRWTGEISPGTASSMPITSVDFFPTLLALAGVRPLPDDPLDGASFASLLTRGDGEEPSRPPIYWHFPGYLGPLADRWRTTPGGAIRAGDWKLLEFFEDGRLELYNLRDDIGENTNLAAALPERADDLRARLATWRKQVSAPMPSVRDPTEPGDVGAPH